MKKLALGAALLGALAVGCGGSSASAPGAPAATETGNPSTAQPTSGVPEAVRTYFEAMATNNSRMLELAAPSSPAHAYAQLQLGQAEASRAGGYPYQADAVTVEDNTIRTCRQDGGCVVFANYATDPSGRVAEFTVNGNPVASRIIPGGQTATAAGMRFQLVGALQTSAANGLNVVIEATNGSQPMTSDSRGLLVGWHNAADIGPDGRQLTVTQYAGPSDLRPNATASYVLQFDGAKPGGTLHISGWSGNNPWEVRFKL